jgi:hypothetical protein
MAGVSPVGQFLRNAPTRRSFFFQVFKPDSDSSNSSSDSSAESIDLRPPEIGLRRAISRPLSLAVVSLGQRTELDELQAQVQAKSFQLEELRSLSKSLFVSIVNSVAPAGKLEQYWKLKSDLAFLKQNW